MIGTSNQIFEYETLLLTLVVRKGGLNAFFDSQAENFLSQTVQSTKSTPTELLTILTVSNPTVKILLPFKLSKLVSV